MSPSSQSLSFLAPRRGPVARLSTLAVATVLALAGPVSWAEEARAHSAQGSHLSLATGTWRLSDETWQLPGGESMGMVGGNLLLQARPGLKLGVGAYGAVRGQRGGFITLGVAAEGRWPIDPDWAVEAGAFVGGGGGRGGSR